MGCNYKFSFVVPIYNVEKYFERCVESLVNQTYRNIEIILVDDESPDNCPQLCEQYARRDNRIRVIHKKNGGLSDARNTGMEIAQGDYIIFVDADDYIEKNTCELLSKMVVGPVDVIVGEAIVESCNINLRHAELKKRCYTGEEYLKKSFETGKCPMAAWLNVYNRLFLLDNDLRFKYGILHEDEQFTPRVFLKAKKVLYTGIEFYHYVVREESITTKKDKRKNMVDLYTTCLELEVIYNHLEDEVLKGYLLNSLCDKYLSMYYTGALYKYGEEYTYKEFLMKNAMLKKTKLKVILFCLSPRIYCLINYISKIKRGLK